MNHITKIVTRLIVLQTYFESKFSLLLLLFSFNLLAALSQSPIKLSRNATIHKATLNRDFKNELGLIIRLNQVAKIQENWKNLFKEVLKVFILFYFYFLGGGVRGCVYLTFIVTVGKVFLIYSTAMKLPNPRFFTSYSKTPHSLSSLNPFKFSPLSANPNFCRRNLKQGPLRFRHSCYSFFFSRSASVKATMCASPPFVHVKDQIDLTAKEKQIFDRLLEVIRHFNLQTQLRVAGGWVRDKVH